MTIVVDKSSSGAAGAGANTDQPAIPPAASSNGRIDPASDDGADFTPNSSHKISPLNNRPSTPSSSSSPYLKSPWTVSERATNSSTIGLLGSLSRKKGHVYSLAASGELLYIGSELNNIRVWNGGEELSGLRSSSGLVKAIVVSGAGSIFTGHQDGKIRVWRKISSSGGLHKRVGTLPGMRDLLTISMNLRSNLRRHFDAVSSLAMDEERGLLYSGSWDKTFKVWRLSDSRCIESVAAHDDAINAVTTSEGIVFTGSADGTVKAWHQRPISESVGTKHALVGVMLRQRHGESAVTSLAVMRTGGGSVVYGGSSDGWIDFWEIVGGEEPVVYGGVFRGHGMAVLCLATAGRVLISGSADRSVRVWRRKDGAGGDVGAGHERVAVMVGHEGPVKCLAVVEEEEVEEEEKGGSRWVVYSGGVDRSVKIWRVTEVCGGAGGAGGGA